MNEASSDLMVLAAGPFYILHECAVADIAWKSERLSYDTMSGISDVIDGAALSFPFYYIHIISAYTSLLL